MSLRQKSVGKLTRIHPAQRQCDVCKTEKLITEFYYNAPKDYYGKTCKVCQRKESYERKSKSFKTAMYDLTLKLPDGTTRQVRVQLPKDLTRFEIVKWQRSTTSKD